ncbi:hypothetical protein EJ02DRAFT_356541, partial [Clathrospora elynae]
IYRKHFDALKAVINKHGINRANMYNIDETVFWIGIGGAQCIVTIDCDWQQNSGSDTNHNYITSIEVISGDSKALPLLLIAQGSVHLQKWYTHTSLPDSYSIALLASGYANNTIVVERE